MKTSRWTSLMMLGFVSVPSPSQAAEEYSTCLKAVYAREKFPKPRNALGREIALPGGAYNALIGDRFTFSL